MRSQLFRITNLITNTLPMFMFNNFYNTQSRSFHFHFLKERDKLDKKFHWLVTQHNSQILLKISPINYRWSITHNSPSTLVPFHNDNHNPLKFSFLSNNNIHPPSPLQIRDKWFVNLSPTHIPQEVQGLLQLGGTFCLPFYHKDKIITEF